MAITRLAFCGSGAAYGTFEAKAESEVVVAGYYPMFQSVIWQTSLDTLLLCIGWRVSS